MPSPSRVGSGKDHLPRRGSRPSVSSLPQPDAPPEVLRRRRQWFAAQNRAADELATFARQLLDQEDAAEAAALFNAWTSPAKTKPAGIDEELLNVFGTWLLYLRPLPGADPLETPSSHTIAARYLATTRYLDRRVRDFIEASRRSPFSLVQITEIQPGVGVRLRDLLVDRESWIYDLGMSQSSRRFAVGLAQVVDLGDLSIVGAFAPSVLEPGAADDIGQLADIAAPMVANDPLRLLVLDEQVFKAYGIQLQRLRDRPPPRLANTDGDPLEPHETRYGFAPGDRAALVAALAALPEIALDDEEDDGQDATTVLTWTTEQPENRIMPNVHKGRLVLGDDTLTLETNSSARDTALRQRVEAACGRRLTYRDTRRTAMADILARKEASPEAAPGGAPEIPPEIIQALRERWLAWADQPVPALGGRTPRAACRSPEGRRQVESLIRDWEFRIPPGGDQGIEDFPALRASLGLEG